MSAPALFGPEPVEPRPRWRIEVTGLGAAPCERIRFSLVDADAGVVVGASVHDFTWVRDIVHGSTITVDIIPGKWAE